MYDTYWRFAAERQRVFFNRFERRPAPWTHDPVLRVNKFTNAYRASDRVSQYLIRRLIYRDDLPDDPAEVVFRILLFKLFNRIETWELLEQSAGPLIHAEYSFKRYDKILSRAMAQGQRIFSAAYIMPSGGSLGHDKKHRNNLTLIERMIAGELPARLAESGTMQQAFNLIREYPSLGDFLAYQYVTDINYSPVTNFTETEFVVPGPGSIDGIRKCFTDTAGMRDADVIRFVAERQDAEFERLGLDFQNLWGRRLQLIDCQNLFCEVDKYARVMHPEVSGASGRTRIKQKFRPHPEPIDYWYPPKWSINDAVARHPIRTNSTTTTLFVTTPELSMDTDKTWQEVQIFPAVLKKRLVERGTKSLKALEKCGLANLWYLCQRANITFKEKAPASAIAKLIRDAAPGNTLIYLCEFVRGRAQSILECYDEERTPSEKTSDESDIEGLSRRRTESPRLLTKLLLMYMKDREVIERIHYRHLWRTARSYAEFETGKFPDDATDRLDGGLPALAEILKKLPDGKKLRVYGSHTLISGPRVYILQRGYKEKLVPEYPSGCKVTNTFGHIVLGFHDSPPRLEIKVANQKFIDAIRKWAEERLDVKLNRRGLTLFEDYTASDLEKKLLGQYSEEHGLAVIGIKFRRTALPNHPSITAEASAGGSTIRDALNWYVEKGALALRSLSDVEWIKIHFDGQEGQVNVKVETDGSVRFTLDNAGWPEEVQSKLGIAFSKTFGIPLDQRINPKPLTMGALEIYQSLLEWDDASEIQRHQRARYDDLLGRDLISVEDQTIHACATAFCSKKGKPVDVKTETCQKCNSPIRPRTIRKIVHNSVAMRKFAGRILKLFCLSRIWKIAPFGLV